MLDRLRECSLTLNLQKCWFRKPQVDFYGLQLSGNGVQPTEEKIRAIVDAPRPTSAADLRSFLGMVGFSARFLLDLSTTAEPLRQITHKNTLFSWTDEQDRAFETLKEQLAFAATLAYFDHTARTQVIADASSVGLGAVLVKQQPTVQHVQSATPAARSPVLNDATVRRRKKPWVSFGLVNVFTSTSAVPPSTLSPITSLCKLYILPHRSHQLTSNAGFFDSRRTTSTLSTSPDQPTLLTLCHVY